MNLKPPKPTHVVEVILECAVLALRLALKLLG